MNFIQKIISNHSGYALLKDKLNNRSDESNLNFINISGLPVIFASEVVKLLSNETKRIILLLERDNLEIRRYLKTAEILNIKQLKRQELLNILSNNSFKHSSKVSEIGEFNYLGDTIMFWIPGYDYPIKVIFWGDDYEQSFSFDDVYGTKISNIDEIILGEIDKLETKSLSNTLKLIGNGLLSKTILISSGEFFSENEFVKFDFNYAELFFHRFDLLSQNIKNKVADGYQIIIESVNSDELPDDLKKYCRKGDMEFDAGFISKELKIFFLTDRELFGTIFLSKEMTKISSTKARQMLANLEGEIEIGDYVVHEDHGIGIYEGLKQEFRKEEVKIALGEYETREYPEDYLLIKYAEGDELYVPLTQLNKITKYINPDSNEPKITRLGKGEWAKIKLKAKISIQIMAHDLVELYAKRALAKAYQVNSEKSQNYENFINAFPYSETEDQLKVEKEVLKDLDNSKPMNRLVVGDVGFGKTEVAIRAAFKVVEQGRQVAVLCPTTVLTAQHLKVFQDRFKDTGYEIRGFSRFSKFSNKDSIEDLKNGKIDIAIGTHRLLSSDVEFAKLGLLIIDEEQKFGVKQKEKLKKIEYGVHVLSMSATPIPRSLSMALSAIQDISIIQTPPEGRKGIKTYVEAFDYQRIVDAMLFEVKRNGQIYYLHNQVKTIESTLQKMKKLLPGIRFIAAHGQLPSEELEKRIEAFYNHEYDCLICTTIIENGIDMPNVNTIVIESAQNYGLGQLHQLRGRVGRSEKQAFAYLFYKGTNFKDKNYENLDANQPKKIQQKKYVERLKAIMEADELGAGFKLASRDLEIRGAGNILGKEQHGSIKNIGYGMYMTMLAEEIERLKTINN